MVDFSAHSHQDDSNMIGIDSLTNSLTNFTVLWINVLKTATRIWPLEEAQSRYNLVFSFLIVVISDFCSYLDICDDEICRLSQKNVWLKQMYRNISCTFLKCKVDWRQTSMKKLKSNMFSLEYKISCQSIQRYSSIKLWTKKGFDLLLSNYLAWTKSFNLALLFDLIC